MLWAQRAEDMPWDSPCPHPGLLGKSEGLSVGCCPSHSRARRVLDIM